MNLSVHKNNIIIAIMLFIFQLYSFQSISFFIDWAIYFLGIEAILLYIVCYKKLPVFSLVIPLLIPWVYVFKIVHYIGYILIILESTFLIYLLVDLYKKSHFKARQQWLHLLLVSSYCFINNMWAIVLDQVVYWFLIPEKEIYLNILQQLGNYSIYKEKFSLSFFPLLYQSNNGIVNTWISPLFYKSLIVKSSIVLLWIFFWGGLYRLSQLSHKHKIFTLPNGGKIYYSWVDLTILLLCFCYSIYHGWYYGDFSWIALGIFCNEILILFLMTSWLLVVANILYDLKIIKSFSLTIVLIIPFLIQHFKIFDYVHILLSQYNFYNYKNHINSSLYMAFSATFLSWFAWIIPICLIVYLLVINKFRLSLGTYISIIGACVFTLSIWSLHHFFATEIVNNSENIRQATFNIILNSQIKVNLDGNISITKDPQVILKQLHACKACHIFPNKNINVEQISKLLISHENNYKEEFINLIPYNVRLVNIMKNDKFILYNLNRPAEITFLSLSVYCIIFFPLFFFWLSLGFILQVAHKKHFNTK